MPELPEVETVCRGLEPRLKNRIISEIQIINPKLRIPIPKELPSKLKNKKILAVKRKAKYILIELEDDLTLIIHLGMSGRVVISKEDTPINKKLKRTFYYHNKELNGKHDHLLIILDDGSQLVYNDTRKFGLVTYTATTKLNQHKLFSRLGIEPFVSEFTAKKLQEIFSTRNKSIKSVLMDASLIVGIGNIYASEILFQAKVHPERIANNLTPAESKLIHKYTLEILKAAIDAGGSSLKDYVQADGNLGYFQNRFFTYDRAGKPCLKCKTEIESLKQNGRTSFYCPKCQN